MKDKNKKDETRKNPLQKNSKRTEKKEHPKIKTDPPLSEKDEVKQAEEKLRKNVE